MNHYEETKIGDKVFRASSVGVSDEFVEDVNATLLGSPEWNQLADYVYNQNLMQQKRLRRLRAYVTYGAWDNGEPRLWMNFIFESENHIIKDRFDIIFPDEALTALDEFIRIIKETSEVKPKDIFK